MITQLGVGEALVSMLDANGTPEIVARALIAPPSARVGPITAEERKALIAKSGLLGKYETPIDRVSAFEVLRDRAAGGQSAKVRRRCGALRRLGWRALGFARRPVRRASRHRQTPAPVAGEIAMRSAVQSAARSAGTQIAHAIMRGVLGGRSK